jgi:RimJ/RimL family protein N-acetyltransferase
MGLNLDKVREALRTHKYKKQIEADQDLADDLQAKPDRRLAPYTDALIGHSLWLRPMFPDDGKAFVKSYGDPIFMQYFGSGRTYNPQQVEANGKAWALKSKDCSRDEWQRWAILGPNGVLGYASVAWNKEEGALDLSYCNVSEPKRGCVTEAARLVIDSTGKSFFATCHPDNRASCAVLEKLGFVKDLNRQNVPQYGATRNYYLLPNGE